MCASPRQKRTPRPLNAASLDELALAYVARFAASGAKLESYLKRKLRERGWDAAGEPPTAAIVARFVAAGYIDDAAYARMKAGAMGRRGYGERRVGQALAAAGIAPDLREEVRAGAAAQLRAAAVLARRRRFGPWGEAAERGQREKQLAAMLRAGHPHEIARRIVHAPDIAAVENWIAEAEDEQED